MFVVFKEIVKLECPPITWDGLSAFNPNLTWKFLHVINLDDANLCRLGCVRSGVGASMHSWVPSSCAVEKRHVLSNRNNCRLGSPTQTMTIGDLTSKWKSGDQQKNLIGNFPIYHISRIHKHWKSPSWCSLISVYFASIWPNETATLWLSFVKTYRTSVLDGLPWKNLPINISWKDLARLTMRS